MDAHQVSFPHRSFLGAFIVAARADLTLLRSPFQTLSQHPRTLRRGPVSTGVLYRICLKACAKSNSIQYGKAYDMMIGAWAQTRSGCTARFCQSLEHRLDSMIGWMQRDRNDLPLRRLWIRTAMAVFTVSFCNSVAVSRVDPRFWHQL